MVGLYTSLVAFLDEMGMSFEVYKKLGEEKLESSQQVLQIEENTPKRVRRAKKFFDDSDTENDSCESSQCQDGDSLKDSF